jgi:uncharacterized protein
VIIIGGGPAGIFAALELLKLGMDRILMLEKGRISAARVCPIKDNGLQCRHCSPCSIVCGWGGAGAFSDGKLTLTPDFGGVLEEYRDREEVTELIQYVDQVYLSYGATPCLYGVDAEGIKEMQRRAATADLALIPARIRHLGTERCYEILCRMRETWGKN